jgi:FtsP/CotA-like multicopper oxidase with cupredoxin domain
MRERERERERWEKENNHPLIFFHSLHLAGHWVFVMEVGYGTPDAPLRADPDSPLAAGAAGGAAKAQPTDAPLVARDTVTLPANGYLRLRWIVDSPGAWLVHCHILMHSYVGLGFIMRDGI